MEAKWSPSRTRLPMVEAPGCPICPTPLQGLNVHNLFKVSFNTCLPGMIYSSAFSTLPEELVLLLE